MIYVFMAIIYIILSITPFKVLYSVIRLYAVFMIYLRKIIRIRDKCLSNQTMNLKCFLYIVLT